MSVPLLLLLLPLSAAILAVILGRWPRVVSMAGAAVALIMIGLLLVAGPEVQRLGGPELTIYGRSLTLTPQVRDLLLLVYGGVLLLFLLATYWVQDRALVPGSLAATAFLSAALSVNPPSYGIFFLLGAVAVTVPMLYAGRLAATGPTWRTFLLFGLAVPLVITADFLLRSGQGESATATYAILLSGLILLGGFPFVMWAGGLGRTAPPFARVFVLGLLQLAVVYFVLDLVDAFPAVRAAPEFRQLVGWSSALSALAAGFLMLRSRSQRDLAAYAVMFDMGVLLLALIVPSPAGQTIAIAAVMARTVALFVLAVAAEQPGLSAPAQSRLPAWLRERAISLPYLLVLLALLSLLGWPLTMGFAARWEQLVAADLPLLIPLLILVAMAMGTVAVARRQSSMLAGPAREDTLSVVISGGLLTVALLLGLFPQLLLEYAARIAGGL